MIEVAEETILPSTSAGSAAVGSLPPSPPPRPVGDATAGDPAESSGKKSFDFPKGTPQGDEERRLWDAERKRLARAAAKLDDPPPLPSAGPRVVDPNEADDDDPDDDDFAAGTAVPDGPPPPVPWEPDALNGLIGELLDAAEEGRVQSFLVRCEQEGLTGKLVKEIERDAHFPKTAKIILKQSLPRLACKWLNKAGISAENQDEVLTLTAVLLIVQSDRRVAARLAKSAEDLKEAQSKPSEAGKALAEKVKGKP